MRRDLLAAALAVCVIATPATVWAQSASQITPRSFAPSPFAATPDEFPRPRASGAPSGHRRLVRPQRHRHVP